MERFFLHPETINLDDPYSKIVYLWSCWLRDRPIIQRDNTPPKVLKLLRAEIDELTVAHSNRGLNVETFDEIPGELADILIFAITWYLSIDIDPTSILQTIDQLIKSAQESDYKVHVCMDSIQDTMSQLEHQAPESQKLSMRLLLQATFLYAKLMGICLEDETLEKIAYDIVRYPAGQLTLHSGENYSPLLYAERLAHLRADTVRHRLKEMFYELPP